MFVKQLKITAFRGIESLDLTFQPGINVLIGVNGVGKSSAIECLVILLGEYVSKLTEKFKSSYTQSSSAIDQLPSILIGANSTIYGNINITDSSVSKQNRDYYPGTQSRILEAKVTDVTTEFDSSFIEITTMYCGDAFIWSNLIENSSKQLDIIHNLDQLENLVLKIRDQFSQNDEFRVPLVAFYTVNRSALGVSHDSPDTLNTSPIGALKDSLTGIHSGFDVFFTWFKTLEDLENEERRDRPDHRDFRLEAVRRAIPAFLPNITNLRIRRSPLRMTVSKEGRELIVNQLSDGEKCLLAMVGDLARRLAIANPTLRDPLQGAGIILIDEIELHLHPQWQRGIIPKLTSTFPNCQFIVSTHSPQIVSDVKPESIYILQQTPQGLIATHPDSSYGRDSNRILEDLMGVPERPQWSDDGLRELFCLIDNGDLNGAKVLKAELELKIGLDEPEFAKADVLIRRKEILGK